MDSGQLEPPDVAITYTGADIRHAADDQVGRLWARHVAACWDPVAVKDALDPFGFPLLEVGSHRMVYGESQEETGQCITEDVIRSMRGVLACAGQDAELILRFAAAS